MSSLIITIINYLQKIGEDQEMVEIIMFSVIITIINYCKNWRRPRQNEGSSLLIYNN